MAKHCFGYLGVLIKRASDNMMITDFERSGSKIDAFGFVGPTLLSIFWC